MTTIYRNSITFEAKTSVLLDFLQAALDETNHYYLGVGQAEQWSNTERDPYFAPPYPDISGDGLAHTWDKMFGLKKFVPETIIPVIPRIDWGDQKSFYLYDIVVTNSIDGVNVPSVSDEGYMVYQCVGLPDAGTCSLPDKTDKYTCFNSGGDWLGAATPGYPGNIPQGKGSDIDTQDGYRWNYLYTIPPEEVLNHTTPEYIVVPTPNQINDNAEYWGLENEINGGLPNRVIYEVKADTLLFYSFIGNSEWAGNSSYRQFSLIKNPLLKKDNPTDPNVLATGVTYDQDEIEEESGEFIFIENRPPIIRDASQSETIYIYFSF